MGQVYETVLLQRRARACDRGVEVGKEIPPARHDGTGTARVGAKLALVQVQQLVRRLISDGLGVRTLDCDGDAVLRIAVNRVIVRFEEVLGPACGLPRAVGMSALMGISEPVHVPLHELVVTVVGALRDQRKRGLGIKDVAVGALPVRLPAVAVVDILPTRGAQDLALIGYPPAAPLEIRGELRLKARAVETGPVDRQAWGRRRLCLGVCAG